MARTAHIQAPQRIREAQVGVALLALAAWALLTPVAGGAFVFPLALGAAWFALERALGIPMTGAPSRLMLLCGYGMLGIVVEVLVAPLQATSFLYDDELFYDGLGRVAASGGMAPIDQANVWGWVVGVVYRTFGADMVHVRGISALAGAILVGLLVEISRALIGEAAGRRMLWLAGASPLLLVWVVAGVRDLVIGLAVALVVSAFILPTARARRFAIGVVLVLTLRSLLIFFPLAVGAIGLAQAFVRTRRPVTAIVFVSSLVFAVYRWGVALGREITAERLTVETSAFVTSRIATSTSSLSALHSLAQSWGILGLIPALMLAVFTPVWFAVVSSGTAGALVVALGGLGWWLLLPAIGIGLRAATATVSSTTIAVWAIGALVASAATLLTTFQDPARMRLTGIGAFFLLATWAIEVDAAAVVRWTKRWAVVNVVLAALYLAGKIGLTSILPLV